MLRLKGVMLHPGWANGWTLCGAKLAACKHACVGLGGDCAERMGCMSLAVMMGGLKREKRKDKYPKNPCAEDLCSKNTFESFVIAQLPG